MTYLALSRATSLEFLNIVDAEMRTAIMCAVVGGKNEILKLLVQCGADVTVKVNQFTKRLQKRFSDTYCRSFLLTMSVVF